MRLFGFQEFEGVEKGKASEIFSVVLRAWGNCEKSYQGKHGMPAFLGLLPAMVHIGAYGQQQMMLFIGLSTDPQLLPL